MAEWLEGNCSQTRLFKDEHFIHQALTQKHKHFILIHNTLFIHKSPILYIPIIILEVQ